MIAAERSARVAALYVQHADTVERLASRRARVPRAVIEDACQTAWMRLYSRDDVSLEEHAAVAWLVITATREGWRHTTRCREVAIGGGPPDGKIARELPQPCGDSRDPLAVVVDREEWRRRLSVLTDRERQFLALQAMGLSYAEIAAHLSASRRTVQRQILRGRNKLRRTGRS